MFIHKTADVSTSKIGKNTYVWQFAVILGDAIIGENCNINCHTFIENDVIIGNNVTIKSGVYLWDGIRLEDNVFVGPAVVFTNDLHPRSKKQFQLQKIVIKEGASIGANSTILGGVNIGKYALVGMGSVVTKNVPDHALVFGNPATIKGWVDENGDKLEKVDDDIYESSTGERYKYSINIGLQKIK